MIAEIPGAAIDVGTWAGILVAVGAAGTLVARWVRAFTHKVVEEIDERVRRQVEPILKEVTFNSGTSLKDMTARNSRDIAKLSDDVAAAATAAALVAKDLAAAHARADAVSPRAESGEAADVAAKSG